MGQLRSGVFSKKRKAGSTSRHSCRSPAFFLRRAPVAGACDACFHAGDGRRGEDVVLYIATSIQYEYMVFLFLLCSFGGVVVMPPRKKAEPKES